MTNPVVGPGIPQANPFKPPVETQKTVDSGLVARINKKLVDSGYAALNPSDDVDGISLIGSLSTNQLSTLGAMLKKRNYTVKASAEYIRNLFATEPELATIAAKSGNDFNKLVSNLAEDIVPGLGKETAPNLPSRQIYQYRDEDIDAIISDAYKAAAMREPSPEELMAQRKTARAKLETGTLSVTKKVKNPKTGKLETVTTQTPGASKTEVQSDIESELKKLNPNDVDRKQRIDFASWLSQNAAGA